MFGNSLSGVTDEQPGSLVYWGDWESDRRRAGHAVFFDYSKAFCSTLGAKLERHGQGTPDTGYVEVD